MSAYFKTIGLAISFSPTTKAMLAETLQLVDWFQSDLVLIHVGEKSSDKINEMTALTESTGLMASRIRVVWVKGDPANEILKVCKQARIDLLVAGALKKENLINHYLGTVARKIMRKANCSIWMITEPTTDLKPLQNIVVDAESDESVYSILKLSCEIASKQPSAWIHVVRELKLLGLALSAREQCTEEEYDEFQKNMVRDETNLVQSTLMRINRPEIKVNIKLLSGKSGFELTQFAIKKSADLLIIQGARKRFSLFDRLFTHDQEYIFSDLPCNLLIYQATKHE